MSTQFETEVTRKVFDNENGELVAVAPDRDGMGCVEVLTEDQSIILLPGHALAVAEAMIALANELA